MKSKDVINHFGGVTATAKALGLSRTAVYQWGVSPPMTSQYRIQVITKGKFKAQDK